MPNIGPIELIIVLIVALLVLGPKKLPEFGRSVGRGMREFKGALTGRDERERPGEGHPEEGPSPTSGREPGTPAPPAA